MIRKKGRIRCESLVRVTADQCVRQVQELYQSGAYLSRAVGARRLSEYSAVLFRERARIGPTFQVFRYLTSEVGAPRFVVARCLILSVADRSDALSSAPSRSPRTSRFSLNQLARAFIAMPVTAQP